MLGLGALIVSCERHDFEETRKLHDKPGLASKPDEGEKPETEDSE